MLDRKKMEITEKALLDAITTLIKAYNEMYLSPLYVHSKTIIEFEGQRYKITKLQTKNRKRHENKE